MASREVSAVLVGGAKAHEAYLSGGTGCRRMGALAPAYELPARSQ